MTEPIVQEKKDLSFKPENFAADLAKIAAEQTVIPPVVELKPEVPAVETPTTPVQPEKATVTPEATKTEVPEKFKTPDGKIDVAKVEKSTLDAETALAKYLAKEKELKQKINEVKRQGNAYINPPPAIAPIPEIAVNTSFAQKIEEDIQKDGAGVVLAKLFTAAQEAAEEKLRNDIDGLKTVNAEATTKIQLEAIAKQDPWAFTAEGFDTLTRILEEQPYMLQAKDPYKAAYLYHKGVNSVASRHDSQVLTPTPTARPVAPVQPGQAADHVQPQIVRLDTREQIDAHLKNLSPEEQANFFQKLGLPKF